jgi:hypothetical protein
MRNLLDRCVESPKMYAKVVTRIGIIVAVPGRGDKPPASLGQKAARSDF